MTEVRVLAVTKTPAVLALAVDGEGVRLRGVSTHVLPLAARASVEAFVTEGRASAMPGQVRELALPGELPTTVLLAGIGAGGPDELRRAGAALVRSVHAEALTVAVPALPPPALSALVQGLALGNHRYALTTTQQPDKLRAVALIEAEKPDVVERALAFCAATAWARELTSTPTSTKTPAWLAGKAARVLEPLGVRMQLRDERWLAEQGFGGVLAVGGGSAAPPRLIEASWRPRGASGGRHVVIAGKGITFDTGGLNLKSGEGMRMMHTDMAGGAAALGALRAIATLRVPARVTVLVPAAENSVSGSAMRPGDVIRHVGGRTTEVRNTDAEGRLVLADALAYAVARLRPSVLVDIATLTGAMKVALGVRTGGLFATSDGLAEALLAAGRDTGERLWRMPLAEEYAGQLHSDVADAQNMPGNPGAITAALFLRPFTAGLPWAHLDIAGPARATEDWGVATRGATGFGAHLLARWVESHAAC